MALWSKAASTRAPSILEPQGRYLCQRWDCNQGFQTLHTFHTSKESLGADLWRTSWSGKCMLKATECFGEASVMTSGRLWKRHDIYDDLYVCNLRSWFIHKDSMVTLIFCIQMAYKYKLFYWTPWFNVLEMVLTILRLQWIIMTRHNIWWKIVNIVNFKA